MIFTLQELSSLYDAMIDGHENNKDQNDKLMIEVYKDFGLNESELKLFVINGMDLEGRDLMKLWDAVYKWDIYNKDVIKSNIVSYIYKNMDYNIDLEQEKDTVSMIYLLKETCINEKNKCETCSDASSKGHLECLKYLHEKMTKS